MSDDDTLSVTLLAESALTVQDLACAGAVPRDWILQRVEQGVLPAAGRHGDEWHFTRTDVWRVRRMYAIERDYEAVPELAALVADLLGEMDALRARLRRAGLE